MLSRLTPKSAIKSVGLTAAAAKRTFASTSHEFELGPQAFHTYNCDSPATTVSASKEELLQYYRDMVTVRRMETMADGMYKAKLIRGFCHLCTGQEAVPVGVEAALEKDDSIITAYRCHGYTYTRGGTIKSILAELMGRRDGIAKGKGGSMHMFAHEFYGGNGIVGAQVPVGAGLAFAQKYLKKPNVTLAFYGDGASNQGQVFEAFNMAKLWSLPCIFVCENNLYGMGTSAQRSSASTEYHSRAGYIPGIKVNGMDILAVKEAVRYAKEWALEKGPLVLEMTTYRYGGHSMSDPGTTYRTREEIQHMRSTNDPITGLKQRIISAGFATENELKAIDKEARSLVEQAAKEARESPEPALEEFWTEIYVPGTEPPVMRGCDPMDKHYYHK